MSKKKSDLPLAELMPFSFMTDHGNSLPEYVEDELFVPYEDDTPEDYYLYPGEVLVFDDAPKHEIAAAHNFRFRHNNGSRSSVLTVGDNYTTRKRRSDRGSGY